jgi:thiamine biosynthesis lipoprotein
MRRLRPLLGTYVEIAARGLAELELERAISEAFAAVELVHRLMSVHAIDSDVSRINRTAWQHPVDVHPWTAQTLRWALHLHRLTDGLFDCAIGHELGRCGVVAGYGFGEAERGSLGDLEVSRTNTVRLARRIAIDLGGIAKGYAVDRAVAALRRAGVRSAVVNAGGDLRVMGDKAEPIYIRDPGGAGPARYAGLLGNGAIATSSAGALIRTRDRSLMTDADTYSVIAPRCVVADALTKVVAQIGAMAARPYLEPLGATPLVMSPHAAAA